MRVIALAILWLNLVEVLGKPDITEDTDMGLDELVEPD